MARTTLRSLAWISVTLLCLMGVPLAQGAEEEPAAADEHASSSEQAPATPEAKQGGKRVIPNKRCLKCHGDEEEKTAERDDGTVVNIFVDTERFEQQRPRQAALRELPQQHHQAARTRSRCPTASAASSATSRTGRSRRTARTPKYKRLDVVHRADRQLHALGPCPPEQDGPVAHQCHLLRLPRRPQHRHPGQRAARRASPEESRGLRPLPREAEGPTI